MTPGRDRPPARRSTTTMEKEGGEGRGVLEAAATARGPPPPEPEEATTAAGRGARWGGPTAALVCRPLSRPESGSGGPRHSSWYDDLSCMVIDMADCSQTRTNC